MKLLAPLLPLVLAAILVPVGPASAQAGGAPGAPTPLGAEAFDLSQLAGLWADEAGRVTGVGGNWDARFEPRGARFSPVPARILGAPAELCLGATRVTRGGVSLELSDVQPTAEGNSAVYRRAPGVEERFEALPEGLFHSLWIERPVGSAGELVVAIGLGGSLASFGERRSDGTHHFGDPMAGVHYGNLTGFDAAGRSAQGEVRLVPGGLEWVLPAEFVDAATWPLLLDPLIGASFQITDPIPFSSLSLPYESDGTPDVAYDVSNDTYLVVWRRFRSAFGTNEQTILGQRFNGAGQPVGSMLLISAVETSRNPRVVSINAPNRFAVAWVQEFFGETQVRLRAVDAATGTMSNSLYVVGLPEGQIQSVAMTGEWSTSLSDTPQAWVFWDSPTGIRGARVLVPNSPSQPTVSATFTAQSGSGLTEPASPRTVTQDGRIALVWVRETTGGSEVWGKVLNRTGAQVQAQRWISFGQAKARYPSIEGGGTGTSSFVVTWNEAQSSCTIFGCTDSYQLFRATFRSGTQLDVGLPVATSSPGLTFPASVAMGWRNQRTLLAYSADTDFYFLGLDTPSGAILEGPVLAESGSDPIFGGAYRVPALCMEASGGSFDRTRGLLVYSRTPQAILFPTSGKILGQWVEAFSPNAVAWDLAGGCGMPGSSYQVTGAPAVGNGTFVARLLFPGSGTSLGIFNIAPPSPGFPWFGCGTCLWVPFFSTIAVPGNSSLITLNLPIPGDPALIGVVVDTQWTVVKLGANPCPLVPDLAASNIQRLFLQ